jgi:hypothetical protein
MAFEDSGHHPQWPKVADAVIEARKLCEKPLLAPGWMMEPFHGEQFPLDSVVGLI